jgi:hypothetical protein
MLCFISVGRFLPKTQPVVEFVWFSFVFPWGVVGSVWAPAHELGPANESHRSIAAASGDFLSGAALRKPVRDHRDNVLECFLLEASTSLMAISMNISMTVFCGFDVRPHSKSTVFRAAVVPNPFSFDPNQSWWVS